MAITLIDEKDDKPRMLCGRALDQRHLAPAGCTVGRPKVDQHRPTPVLREVHPLAVQRREVEIGRGALSCARWRCESAHGLQGVQNLRHPPPVAVARQQLASLFVELRVQGHRQGSSNVRGTEEVGPYVPVTVDQRNGRDMAVARVKADVEWSPERRQRDRIACDQSPRGAYAAGVLA